MSSREHGMWASGPAEAQSAPGDSLLLWLIALPLRISALVLPRWLVLLMRGSLVRALRTVLRALSCPDVLPGAPAVASIAASRSQSRGQLWDINGVLNSKPTAAAVAGAPAPAPAPTPGGPACASRADASTQTPSSPAQDPDGQVSLLEHVLQRMAQVQDRDRSELHLERSAAQYAVRHVEIMELCLQDLTERSALLGEVLAGVVRPALVQLQEIAARAPRDRPPSTSGAAAAAPAGGPEPPSSLPLPLPLPLELVQEVLSRVDMALAAAGPGAASRASSVEPSPARPSSGVAAAAAAAPDTPGAAAASGPGGGWGHFSGPHPMLAVGGGVGRGMASGGTLGRSGGAGRVMSAGRVGALLGLPRPASGGSLATVYSEAAATTGAGAGVAGNAGAAGVEGAAGEVGAASGPGVLSAAALALSPGDARQTGVWKPACGEEGGVGQGEGKGQGLPRGPGLKAAGTGAPGAGAGRPWPRALHQQLEEQCEDGREGQGEGQRQVQLQGQGQRGGELQRGVWSADGCAARLDCSPTRVALLVQGQEQEGQGRWAGPGSGQQEGVCGGGPGAAEAVGRARLYGEGRRE